jgi:peptidoglycan L-alanyl-D-glutamate endopeptidase CwlK
MLDSKSRAKLRDVHPALAGVILGAAEISPLPFTVLEGKRSLDRQRALLASGASRTMDSRHLTGHAVDIAPLVEDQVRWDWPLFYRLAPVVKLVASRKGVALVWGGVWDRPLAELCDVEQDVADYIQRRRAVGKKAFIDGPHFELGRTQYPA